MELKVSYSVRHRHLAARIMRITVPGSGVRSIARENVTASPIGRVELQRRGLFQREDREPRHKQVRQVEASVLGRILDLVESFSHGGNETAHLARKSPVHLADWE